MVAAQLPLLVGMAEPEQRQEPAPLANNIVGLNLARLHQPRYVWVAGQIANANGGSWGYVTVLLTNQERDDAVLPQHVLQQLLDRCYESKVQPIVRVGTRFDSKTGIWERPTDDDPVLWRTLFEKVRWPNSPVWVVPANEPNLGREWGGKVDVESYARYLERFMHVFEDSNRFKVVNAPLNLSNAHNPPDMQDAFEFLSEHLALTPSVFERLPAWATNSYRVDGLGDGQRFTHLGYELELDQIGRELPVLITESGLLNTQDQDEIARFFAQAYGDWQRDRRVLAATPLFWDPDVDNHWMFSLDERGNVETGSATYRVLRELPRQAGSPNVVPPMANTSRVSASAVKARPLPIFLPDPPSPASGLGKSRDANP